MKATKVKLIFHNPTMTLSGPMPESWHSINAINGQDDSDPVKPDAVACPPQPHSNPTNMAVCRGSLRESRSPSRSYPMLSLHALHKHSHSRYLDGEFGLRVINVGGANRSNHNRFQVLISVTTETGQGKAGQFSEGCTLRRACCRHSQWQEILKSSKENVCLPFQGQEPLKFLWPGPPCQGFNFGDSQRRV